MNKDKTDSGLIKHHLLQEYDIEVDRVSNGPRGFVAETYVVEARKRKYFVKMVKKGRYDHNLVKSVEAQCKLCEKGLKRIPCPVPSNSGNSTTDLDDLTFILFNFIDGKWTFDYMDEELLDIVVKLHRIKPKVVGVIEKEDFKLPYERKLLDLLETVYTYSSGGVFETTSRKYLEPYKEEIYKDWKNFNRLIDTCKVESFELKNTHGDPWGNVLRSEDGGIYLFDWDDIALAPVERDLWFKLNDLNMINYYQRTFPEYKINKLAYDFYLYNRYFYDLYGFLIEIFSEKPKEHKEENYKLILKDWNDWLRILVRERIDKY